jgi:hypothetical protein
LSGLASDLDGFDSGRDDRFYDRDGFGSDRDDRSCDRDGFDSDRDDRFYDRDGFDSDRDGPKNFRAARFSGRLAPYLVNRTSPILPS